MLRTWGSLVKALHVEYLGKLGKGLTKQDHIVIVGGPGNSLDGNHYYSVVKEVVVVVVYLTTLFQHLRLYSVDF
jgi:hypothetical protein